MVKSTLTYIFINHNCRSISISIIIQISGIVKWEKRFPQKSLPDFIFRKYYSKFMNIKFCPF